jgi:hypothetical protein
MCAHAQTPNDMSYTYSGYAPLSVRLLEKHQVSGWRSIGELLNALPGPTIRETQSVPQSALKRRMYFTAVTDLLLLSDTSLILDTEYSAWNIHS